MRWMRFLTRGRAGCELRRSPRTPLPACARLALVGAMLVVIVGGLDRAVHAAEAVALHGDAQSWEYLAHKLVADGINAERVGGVFADARFGAFTGLAFTLHPREPRAMYRGFLRSSSIARARACRTTYHDELDAAERRFGVSANVLTAVLHVETGCGGNTGRNLILPKLARLAMANDPSNVELNIERLEAEDPADASVAREVKARAGYLESTFYPEVLATFVLSDRLHVDPLEIRGSASGAFGIPQFLPRSYLRYGVDGNGNGRVSLFEPADAIASCANYLASNGWKPGLRLADRRRVLWSYNHSPAYIDTVLALAMRLDAPAPETRAQRVQKPKNGSSHRTHERSTTHSAQASTPHGAGANRCAERCRGTKAKAVAQN